MPRQSRQNRPDQHPGIRDGRHGRWPASAMVGGGTGAVMTAVDVI